MSILMDVTKCGLRLPFKLVKGVGEWVFVFLGVVFLYLVFECCEEDER